jgi:hypothetical protein
MDRGIAGVGGNHAAVPGLSAGRGGPLRFCRARLMSFRRRAPNSCRWPPQFPQSADTPCACAQGTGAPQLLFRRMWAIGKLPGAARSCVEDPTNAALDRRGGDLTKLAAYGIEGLAGTRGTGDTG